MSSHLYLYTSLRSSRFKQLTTHFPIPIRRYSQTKEENEDLFNHQGAAETVEELQREIKEIDKLEEEKAKQGISSQTVEKVIDGFDFGDGEAGEWVKDKLVEPVDVGDFHKVGDENDKGVLER